MKMFIQLLALCFLVASLSGCSTCKKCTGTANAAEYSPATTASAVAAEPAAAPVAEPAEEAVPEAAKRYIK